MRILGAIIIAFGTFIQAEEPLALKLFDSPPTKPAPVSEKTAKLIATYGKPGPNRVMDVAEPTMTVYRAQKPNGVCVIVAPGGGYMFMSYQTEGSQVCEWLNTIGVTGVLLKYRVPTRDEKEPFTMPVEDARQAMKLVRARATEWKINPKRVGLLGFSAGGNLLGHAAWDTGERPDFGVMIYGGGFLDYTDKTKFKPGFTIPKVAPPMFFAVAHDDKSNPEEAARLYLEYKRLGLPAELHIFSKGGHGFGMRKTGFPIDGWPQRAAEWMMSIGYFK
jgi:acetyl esterase/lipase